MLGLNIALGQLQRTAGADQRATASAAILSQEGYAAVEADKRAKQWTGVWDSTQPQADGFLGWLVSSDDTIDNKTLNAVVEPAPDAELIELVGPGTLGSSVKAANLRVTVPVAKVPKAIGEGRYAFWVGDEGVKARFQGTLPSKDEEQTPSTARREADFRINQRNALETYGDLLAAPVGSIISPAMTNQPNSFTRKSLLLPDTSETEVPDTELLGETFADFSPYPVGLLTNAKDGGWKKDLTWLFETSSVNTELATIDAIERLPGSQVTPEWSEDDPNGWPQDSSRSHWPAPPTWELLKDYYRLGLESAPHDARPQTDVIHGISPTITHYALSLIPGLDGSIQDNVTPSDPNDDYFRGRLRVYIDLRIALWNPYDTAIRLPDSDLEILWRQESEGTTVDAKMYFGSIILRSNGSILRGKSHTGTILSNFAGENGLGFFQFNDTFYGNSSGHGLSFRVPEITLGPGEIVFLTIADSEDGKSYTGQNRLESLQNLGFPNTVWMQHSDLIDKGTIPLAGEDLINAPFSMIKSDVVQGGAQIHHLALREAGTAGNYSANTHDEFYGRFFCTPTSALETFYQKINLDNNDLVEEVFGSPPIRNLQTASPSFQTDHSMQQRIHMHGSKKEYTFRMSRWARNYNPRAAFMRQTEVDILNNPLTHTRWESSNDLYSGPFKNTNISNGIVRVADRPTFGDVWSQHQVALYSLPQQGIKPLSLGDLRHVDVNSQLGSNNYPIGGSLVDMRLKDTSETVRLPSASKRNEFTPIIDGAYLLNEALWDGYFFSTIDDSITQEEIDAGAGFPNSRIQLARDQLLSDFQERPDRFSRGAADLTVEGQFNVNSSSKEAWKAVLASSIGAAYNPDDPTNTGVEAGIAFSRLLTPLKANTLKENSWLNYRTLEETELEALATEIVEQVKRRGPFLTLAEFINRPLGAPADGDGLQGALAQAIDDSEVNSDNSNQLDIPPDTNVKGGDDNWNQVESWYIEEAVLGSRSAGATRWLMQGDLLSRIGGMITTRSDTFLIRSYGSSLGIGGGTSEAEAYLEAVVQRLPEAVEPVPGDPIATTGEYGRKFRVVSLRWLGKEEI